MWDQSWNQRSLRWKHEGKCEVLTTGRSGRSLCLNFKTTLLKNCVHRLARHRAQMFKFVKKKKKSRTSLVALRMRIFLPVQRAWVQYLVWEDSTCCGATKPGCHSSWAHTVEPASCSCWPRLLQLLKPTACVLHKRSDCSEKPAHCNEEVPALTATRESLHKATETQCSQK